MLLKRSPLDFEAWAVTSIPGLAPNERRVGDRGIDGRGAMMHQPDAELSRLVVAQVKGGGYTASSMRDFQRVIEREKAAAGVYITLRKVTTKGRSPSRDRNGHHRDRRTTVSEAPVVVGRGTPRRNTTDPPRHGRPLHRQARATGGVVRIADGKYLLIHLRETE